MVHDFVYLFHLKPVQNIITIKQTMCVLCPQWSHLILAVGRIWHGEINKFTESLNVSSTWLKKQYFIMNSLKTSKTHALSM